MNVLNHQEHWYLLWLVDLEKNNVQIMTWLIFLYGMNVRPGIIQITLLSILEGNNWPKVSMWLAAVQNYDVFFSLKQYFQSSLEENQDIIYINGTGFLLWHLTNQICKTPGVDCSNLLTSFTGIVHVDNLQISTCLQVSSSSFLT